MKAWVLNGPNLNLLGQREPQTYGSISYVQLQEQIQGWARELQLEVECFQSNSEGELLDQVQRARGQVDFLVLNPGALTHTSIALRDALAAVALPAYEVHISNIYQRESWRRHSTISEVCCGVVSGFGLDGYRCALLTGAARHGGD